MIRITYIIQPPTVPHRIKEYYYAVKSKDFKRSTLANHSVFDCEEQITGNWQK